jgi:polyhydroxybutyrate depolymerase
MPAARRRGAAACAALIALAAFALGARADDGSTVGAAEQRELRSGGLTRTYRVVPSRVTSSDGRALVMVLHGGFGSGAFAERAYGWDAVTSSNNAEIVYPDGYRRSWNGGNCCGPAHDRNVDDVAFLTAIILDAEQRDGVDPKRVFVTGMSNGAIMAYRLACEGRIALAAIGPVAGALEVPCAAPAAPVSVMAIHGTADQNVPYAGGVGTKGFVKVDHTSVASSLARWLSIDRCEAQPATSRSGGVVRETTECASGTTIVLITVEGAGHQWPGSTLAAPAAARLLNPDPPSRALSATDALWLFFKGHTASSPGPNAGR